MSRIKQHRGFQNVFWYLFYRTQVIERPRISYHQTNWNIHLIERLRLPAFHPIAWAWGAHAQTTLHNFLNYADSFFRVPSTFRRESIVTFDENLAHLDWYDDDHHEVNSGSDSRPIVLILHGIAGSAD